MDGTCVLRGHRVVIPQNLRQKVVAEFHKGHPEVVKMKALAKSHVVAWVKPGSQYDAGASVISGTSLWPTLE